MPELAFETGKVNLTEDQEAQIAKEAPNYGAILPAAALRAGAGSALAQPPIEVGARPGYYSGQ